VRTILKVLVENSFTEEDEEEEEEEEETRELASNLGRMVAPEERNRAVPALATTCRLQDVTAEVMVGNFRHRLNMVMAC
jgi:hypothetical protein